MSELVRIDDTTWELPASARDDMRVPARVFADARSSRRSRATSARAAPERRDAAGHRRRGARDAGHPPGLRLPGRRRRGHGAPGRRRLARRRRLRHQLRRAAARPAADGGGARRRAARRSCTRSRGRSRRRRQGDGLAELARPRARRGAARRAARARRARIGRADDVERTESEGRLDGRRPGRGLRARASAGPRTARHDGLRQPLRRGADRRATSSTRRPPRRSGSSAARSPCWSTPARAGSGHQVCTDYVRAAGRRSSTRYRIDLPDRQLACAPASSPEGRALPRRDGGRGELRLGEPAGDRRRACDARSRACSARTSPDGTAQVYDVAHNIAKVETPRRRATCASTARARPEPSRRAPTRSRPPTGPSASRSSSRDHGHGELRPRRRARLRWSARSAPRATAPAAGSPGRPHESGFGGARAPAGAGGARHRRPLPVGKGLAEEAPFAYKDVDRVVRVVERAGLARRVARLVPLGVVKG